MYDFEDHISVYVNGAQYNRIKSYHVSRGIIEQPSSISVTAGSGDISRELMAHLQPLSKIEVRLYSTPIFTGVLEDVTCDNSSGATDVTASGRDPLYQLSKAYIQDEKAFGNGTYLELTKEVLRRSGFNGKGLGKGDDSVLVVGNDDNRAASLRTGVKKLPATRKVIEQEQTNLVSGTGAKVVYEKVVGQVGQSYLDFLISQYKKAGIFLMCGAWGEPILMVPDPFLEPSYRLFRDRDVPRKPGGLGTIMRSSWSNRTSSRHAGCVVYGKGRPDKNGHFAVAGSFSNVEMTQTGFDADTDVIVFHDNDAKNIKELHYIARRHIAEEDRQNRRITYTVAGHTTESISVPGMMIPWTPDTIVSVSDNEIQLPGSNESHGIQEDMYIERVDYDRDAKTGTTTTLHLMRLYDVRYFGDDENFDREIEQLHQTKHNPKTFFSG